MNKRVLILFLILSLGIVNAEMVLDQSNDLPPEFQYSPTFGGNARHAQSFQPSVTADISLVQLPMAYSGYLYPPGGPVYEIILEIQTDYAGQPSENLVSSGCTATIPPFTDPAYVYGPTTAYAWFNFIFENDCLLDANTSYWMVIRSPETPATNAYALYPSHANNYLNGIFLYTLGGGWTDSGVLNYDFIFKEYVEPITCFTNSDCGTDAWVEAPSCQEGNVYQNYRVFTCNEPGTPASYCTESDTFSLKEVCVDPTPFCENGECVSDMPLDQRVFVLEQQVQELTNQNDLLNERVSTNESAIITINQLISAMQTALNDFVDKITGYLSNMNFNARQEMLCGYMEDENLNYYSDLELYCHKTNDNCTCSDNPIYKPLENMK